MMFINIIATTAVFAAFIAPFALALAALFNFEEMQLRILAK